MKFTIEDDFLIYDGECDILICNLEKKRNYGLFIENEKIREKTGKKIKVKNFVIYNVNNFKIKIKLIIAILKM